MDLFTYLLGKNGKNTHRDLFSYLLGKNAGGSGTYTTFSGTSLNISNTLQAKIKNIALEGNTSQDTTSGKNLFNSNSRWYKNYLTSSGSIGTDNSALMTYDYIEAKPSTGYVLSWVWGNLVNSHKYIYLCFYDEEKTHISRRALGPSDRTFTTPNNCKYVRISWYHFYDTEGSLVSVDINNVENYLKNIQLEEGTQATAYEPYTGGQPSPNPDYPQPIKVVTGEQNVEISGTNMVDQSVLFSTLTYNPETGYYSGTPSSAINSTTTGIFKENTRYTVKCVAYTTSTASTKESIQFRFDYSDGTETHINLSNNSTATTKTLTSASGKTVTSFQITYARARDINIKDLMLYEGTNTTQPYVPYQKQTYPLSLGNIELAKINDYKDYIFKNVVGSTYYNADLDLNGWYKYTKINKWSPTGNGNWINDYGTNLFTPFKTPFFTNIFIVGYGLSNYYKYNSVQSGLNNNLANGEFTIQETSMRPFFKNTLFNNTTDFKADLQEKYNNGNPLIIRFPLETPIYEKITDTTLIQQLESINKANSYKGTTIIECTSASTDNETIVFSGEIKVTSVSLGNSLNTSLLSNNLQNEEPLSLDNTNEDEIEEPIENEEVS